MKKAAEIRCGLYSAESISWSIGHGLMMVSTSVDIPDDATYEEAIEVVEERLYNGTRVTGEWMGLKKVAQLRDEERDRAIVSDA